MSEPAAHTRVSNILLGRYEQAALTWFSRRMPARISSDFMMVLGLAGAFVTAGGYFLTRYDPVYLWLASFGLILNWFGDSMDGTLARQRREERPRYGYFMDHSLDVLGGSAIGIGIGFSPYVEFEIALIAVIGYLLMSLSTHIRTHATGVFMMSYGKVGTTEIRALMILANTVMFFIGNPAFQTPLGNRTLYDMIGVVLAAGEFGFFVFTTLSVGMALRKEESAGNR